MENEQAGSTAYKSFHSIHQGLGRQRTKEMGERDRKIKDDTEQKRKRKKENGEWKEINAPYRVV